MRNLSFILVFISFSSLFGQEESPSNLRLSAIPALSFGSDDGLGGGAIGNIYLDKPGFEPYKMSVGLKFLITTKLVNSHVLTIDYLRAFGLPWRLNGRLGFYSAPASNYCGIGIDANCSEDRAKTEAARLGLAAGDADLFIKRYYQNRSMSFFGDVLSRWLLWQGSVAKLELMTSYRGRYYLNRDFSEQGPYANSLYAKDFGQTKIDGYLSTLELGLMLDARDNEPAPTSGYWLESSIRGGSKIIGSAWDHLGGNLAARFYWSLDDDHRLVIASQSIVDSLMGDMPYDAISRIGGSLAMNDFNAIGGQYLGRGIREQLYVGRFKAIEQLEFRYRFWSFDLWRQKFDLTAVGLGDFGMTAWDLSRFTKDMQTVHTGFGAGLRLHWNKTFIVRADLGMSPAENFLPRFYLTVGNVF